MLTLAFNIQQAESLNAPETELSKTYGGTNQDRPMSVVQTTDGGYAVAGLTRSFGASGSDFWLVKTNSTGHMGWNRTYGGIADDMPSDHPHFMIQANDGGYVMAGLTFSFGAGCSDLWLVKTDVNGNTEWSTTFGGNNYDRADSVIQTSDEGYIVAGATHSFGSGGINFWLIKVDSWGNMQWNKTYGGTYKDFTYSMILTDDEGYAIAGATESYGVGGEDFWLIKLAPRKSL